MTAHVISADIAPKIIDWMKTRGGVEVWKSLDLATPGKELMTPLLTEEGTPREGKPHWSVGEEPTKVITKLEDLEVVVTREVKRFRVGLKRARGGTMFKCTDAASARIRRECEKAASFRCAGCGEIFLQSAGKDVKVGDHGTGVVCPKCDHVELEVLNAFHRFDYSTQEAVILIEDRIVSARAWELEQCSSS